jgi:hypothetical protein
MLKPSEFEEKQKGINKFLDIIESQIEQQEDLELKKDFNEKKKTTWYLDTDNFRLNSNKFLLRICICVKEKSKMVNEFKAKCSVYQEKNGK